MVFLSAALSEAASDDRSRTNLLTDACCSVSESCSNSRS